MEFFSIGEAGTLHIYGVKLVGANAANAGKLGVTIGLLALLLILRWLARSLLTRLTSTRANLRTAFWMRQGVNVGLALVFLVGFLSIWFDDPTRLTTGLGLVTAGLAFALQKVVTSLAGYLVLLRGRNFSVGDRIVMGGVRGDVIALDFTQTTIMEMGQPPGVQSDAPAMWVKSRQYTGRIVTVPNSKIFDEPIYNYTRDFQFIWEELTIPVSYADDHAQAEAILLQAALRHHVPRAEVVETAANDLRDRYFSLQVDDFEPRVFLRLTDNWIELTVRFLTNADGVREVKDAMSRYVLTNLQQAGIGPASTTLEIVGMPALDVRTERTRNARETVS